ncbi:hypothetical protein KIPB_016918, partial [Kipferlia bialata]
GVYLLRVDFSGVRREMISDTLLAKLRGSVLTNPTAVCLNYLLQGTGQDIALFVPGVSVRNDKGMEFRYSVYLDFRSTYPSYRKRVTCKDKTRTPTSKPQLVLCDNYLVGEDRMAWLKKAVSVIPAYEVCVCLFVVSITLKDF